MTTKQNPNVSMLDEDLDQVSGGILWFMPLAALKMHQGAMNSLSGTSLKRPVRSFTQPTEGDDI